MEYRVPSLVLGMIFLLSSAAFGVEFWPLQEGLVFHYEAGVEVTYFSDSRQLIYPPPIWGNETSRYVVDDQGDVVMDNYAVGGYGMVHPDDFDFDPPVKFLDLPLEVGKTWSTTTFPTEYGSEGITFSYEVLSEEIITVPYGTFPVFVVQEFSPMRVKKYYLNRYYGPISIDGLALIDIDGVVSEEVSSWGRVKALYR